MASITSVERAWIPTLITAGVFWLLLLIAALMPEICPAISPAPASCAADARETAAMSGAVLVLAAAAAGVAVTYLAPPRARPIALRWAMFAVAVVGVVALALTVGASGFIVF
jgi:hypothetical protein